MGQLLGGVRVKTARTKRTRWQTAGPFEASQAQFRNAAHAMIKTGSLASLSMRGLALAVGASPMTAYRYYPDKDALIADVRMQVWREFIGMLNASAFGVTDPAEFLRAMALAYLKYAVEHEYEYRLIFEGPRPEGESDGASDQPDLEAWKLLRGLVARITGNGEGVRSSHYAHLIWSSLHGLATLHHADRLSLEGDIDEVGPHVIELLVKIVSAD